MSRYKVKQRRRKVPTVRLDFSREHDDELDILLDNFLSLFARHAAKMYNEIWPRWAQHGTVQVSIRSVSAEEMAVINAEFRDTNTPTDVLTFPLYERDNVFVPDERPLPLLLGDIILCPTEIRKNASSHGVTELSELALIIFHGLLHLLAWDHDTPEKEERMWSVQERYRDRFLSDADNGSEKRT